MKILKQWHLEPILARAEKFKGIFIDKEALVVTDNSMLLALKLPVNDATRPHWIPLSLYKALRTLAEGDTINLLELADGLQLDQASTPYSMKLDPGPPFITTWKDIIPTFTPEDKTVKVKLNAVKLATLSKALDQDIVELEFKVNDKNECASGPIKVTINQAPEGTVALLGPIARD